MPKSPVLNSQEEYIEWMSKTVRDVPQKAPDKYPLIVILSFGLSKIYNSYTLEEYHIRPEDFGDCKKCEATEKVITEWVNKKNNDKCWWFPELLEKLQEIHGLEEVEANIEITEKEFEENCTLFRKSLFFKH